MKFTVMFIQMRKERGDMLIEMDNNDGLDMVENIEKQLGFKIDNIENLTVNLNCPISTIYSLEIDRKLAEQIPHFRDKSQVNVNILKSGSFGKYMKMIVEEKIQETLIGFKYFLFFFKKRRVTRKIVYDAKFVINERQIIEDWIKDGNPLEWNI